MNATPKTPNSSGIQAEALSGAPGLAPIMLGRDLTEKQHEVLTIQEAANELRCSKTHVSHLVNGKIPNAPPLPHVKIGRRVLIRRASLARWMESLESSRRGPIQ